MSEKPTILVQGLLKIALPIVFIALIAFAAGCVSEGGGQTTPSPTPPSQVTVRYVEVFHFYESRYCEPCDIVGQYAEETVNLHFSDELEDGTLIFSHYNIDETESSDVVKEYGVTGPSLWIGVYTDDACYREENINVWYKVNDKEAYINYLRPLLEKRLRGEL
jgi:hypothetical protein